MNQQDRRISQLKSALHDLLSVLDEAETDEASVVDSEGPPAIRFNHAISRARLVAGLSVIRDNKSAR